MSVYRYYKVTKDGEKIPTTWYCSAPYIDLNGEKQTLKKRGFEKKSDAQKYEREFFDKLACAKAELELHKKENINEFATFEEFLKIYESDKKNRIREHTWQTKNNLIEKKILPYFKDKKINDITRKDIMRWHNTLTSMTGKDGKPYSEQYLRTIHNQLSAILNHAVNYYELPSNPAAKECIFKKTNTHEMLIWTKDEYTKFADAIMDKPRAFYAFEMLYWCGIRLGELLALTPSSFDFDKKLVNITKSYQKIEGRDVITKPKTSKSIRKVKMPDFLCEEMQEYINSFYKIGPEDRIFQFSSSFLRHEMERGSKAAGVQEIRIHDLRHSHVSLLIHLKYSVVAIADRLGHEAIEITYQYAHLFPSVQDDMVKELDSINEITRGGSSCE